MHPMMRRGFTLMELLIGLVMMGILGTALIKTMTSVQRATQAQAARTEAQESMRSAAFYISGVLRELDANEGDLITAGTNSIIYRAPRWSSVSCTGVTTSGANLQVTVRKSLLWGPTVPSPANDSLFVFDEITPDTRADDKWLGGKLTDTLTQNCPDGTAGLRLSLVIDVASGGNAAATAGFTLGSPLRGFQREKLELYTDGSGQNWLGQSAADNTGTWSAITPLAGTLTTSGLSFTYYDTLNVVTASTDKVASVGMVVRSQSITRARRSTNVTGNFRDSVITRVGLRNNKRF